MISTNKLNMFFKCLDGFKKSQGRNKKESMIIAQNANSFVHSQLIHFNIIRKIQVQGNFEVPFV